MITVQEMVSREVHYCVSSLVNTLASAGYEHGADDLGSLMDQAWELAAPIDDWEEPLIEAGWSHVDIGDGQVADWRWQHAEDIGPGEPDAQAACEEANLDPYQREVYEHWIVSAWLADKLEAQGEKVDRDFAGMVVWARTTTGQMIAADELIERIHAELIAA